MNEKKIKYEELGIIITVSICNASIYNKFFLFLLIIPPF